MQSASLMVRNCAALTLACCALSTGCASPLLGWADYKKDKQLEAAAADDSFPTAAEVGLASTNK